MKSMKILKKLGISVLGIAMSFGIASTAFSISASAADLKKCYTGEELLAPAMTKNTDANGVYRQLRLALKYEQINEGAVNHFYFDKTMNVPAEAMKMLYKDGLISSYTYKCVTGEALTAADLAGVFDATYYYNNNADLQAAIGNDANALLTHFVKYGMKEGRQGNATFNPASYRTKNTDVSAAYGDNLSQYYRHYLLFGRYEGR
ncbi:hypothetical protein [Butyrivibrio sp. XPD2002]|uniref:hypothetical protein n=1 Tax=Butyrivibrio sp. XPD2002 TaxID=1280665 RepID=UPI00041239BA|nr:hypothetical protein [Butyrivibrio sp. XPD2002]